MQEVGRHKASSYQFPYIERSAIDRRNPLHVPDVRVNSMKCAQTSRCPIKIDEMNVQNRLHLRSDSCPTFGASRACDPNTAIPSPTVIVDLVQGFAPPISI